MKPILSLALVVIFFSSPAAIAEVSDDDFQQLRDQLAAMSVSIEIRLI